MLKGDLAVLGVADVLAQLASDTATGCLFVAEAGGDKAEVYLRKGQVYSATAPGWRPQLGSRLVASGALSTQDLAQALEAQRTELQGWRLGELLVHMGFARQDLVEAFVHEQVLEALSTLLRWSQGSWKFRIAVRTREDVAPPTAVEQLLEEIRERRDTWDAIVRVLHGPTAVLALTPAGVAADLAVRQGDSASVLTRTDGVRTLADLARECGFTLHEAGRIAYDLAVEGLLTATSDDEVASQVAVMSQQLARALADAPDVVIPAARTPPPEPAFDAAAQRRATEQAASRRRDAAALAALQAELEEGRLLAQGRTERDDATAMARAELSATAASSSASAPERVPAPDPEPEPVAVAPHEPEHAIAFDTDTASLFRELSSLGQEQDEPEAPSALPRSRPPTRTPPPAAKKRKGLFGF